MPEIFAVDPKQLEMFRGAVGPFIDSAMAVSSYGTSQDVYDAIEDKRAVLWIVWDGEILAVVVTQLLVRSKAKACSIWICEGREHERWYEQLVARIEDYGRAEGCTLMRHEARKGWERKLKPLGYRSTHMILEKAL